MRVAIYIRVSTEEQARDGYSPEVQEEALRKYVKDNKWELYSPDGQVYKDQASGYSMLRPALAQLRHDAKLKKFDLVLVFKIDRFSRKLKDLLNIFDELDAYGVALKSSTEPYDTTTSAGKLMFQQLGSFAEFERNRIVERVVPGMKKSLERGNWQGGKPPYGYRYDKKERLLCIHPEEAELVKLIHRMYLENKPLSNISGFLYEQGYRTRCGKKFYPTLICNILKSKIYLGKIEWGRRTVDKQERAKTGRYKVVKNAPEEVCLIPGRHEPLISQEDYDLIQQKLAANRKGSLCRNRSSGYPLTGVLYCGKCGHRFRGSNVYYSRHNKNKKRYYRCCGNVDYKADCDNSSFQAEAIEPQIFKIIQTIVEHPKLQHDRIDGLFQYGDSLENRDLHGEAKVLKGQLKDNLAQQTQLWKKFSAGKLAEEVYDDQCLDMRLEERRIKSALAKLDMKMIEKERTENYRALLKKVVMQFKQTKENIDLPTTKDFIQLIFKRVVIENKKIIDIEVYEPFETLLRELSFDLKAVISVEKEVCTTVYDGRAF